MWQVEDGPFSDCTSAAAIRHLCVQLQGGKFLEATVPSAWARRHGKVDLPQNGADFASGTS